MFRPMLPLFALAVLIALSGSSCHDHHPRGDGGDMGGRPAFEADRLDRDGMKRCRRLGRWR